MTRSVPQAIAAGLEALTQMQAADGSFPLWMGTSQWRPCGRLFSTSYVMMGAGGLLPAVNIARAVDFIRGQRRSDMLWEYDPAIRVPPDSDCTACSLAVLAVHGDRSDVAGGADLLRRFWRNDHGPFRSWPAIGMWAGPERDDCVVNCNVVHALDVLGSPATETEKAAVVRLIKRTNGIPRYYCSPATTAHAARRARLDLDTLPRAAIARPSAKDLLGCVRWLCAMPERDEEMIGTVLAAQRPDGSWPIWPWVTGAIVPRTYWGSPAVTTALAVEALSRAAYASG